MTTMRVLAKAGAWEVIQDANSVIHVLHDKANYVCDAGSAYEMIVEAVADKETRAALLKELIASMGGN